MSNTTVPVEFAVPDAVTSIAVAGPMGCGKTSMAQRWSRERPPAAVQPTLGSDIESTSRVLDGKVIRVHVFDTAGMERFAPITNQFIRNKDVVLACYDRSSLRSLDELVERWAPRLRSLVDGHTKVVLVACRCDRAGQIDAEEEEAKLLRFREVLGDRGGDMPLFATSAASGKGVEAMMRAAMRLGIEARRAKEEGRRPAASASSAKVGLWEARGAAQRRADGSASRRFFLCFPLF